MAKSERQPLDVELAAGPVQAQVLGGPTFGDARLLLDGEDVSDFVTSADVHVGLSGVRLEVELVPRLFADLQVAPEAFRPHLRSVDELIAAADALAIVVRRARLQHPGTTVGPNTADAVYDALGSLEKALQAARERW